MPYRIRENSTPTTILRHQSHLILAAVSKPGLLVRILYQVRYKGGHQFAHHVRRIDLCANFGDDIVSVSVPT